MKMKITAYLLLMTMVATMFSFGNTAFAAGVTTFDMALSNTNVITGATVTYTISAYNISDMDAFELNITFDSDKLEPVTGGLVSNVTGGAVIPQVKGNKIVLAFAKNKDKAMENGNMSLASITFKAKKAGTANVTMNTAKLLNSILAETNYTVSKSVSVTITDVSGPIITVNVAGDKKGTTLTVNVNPDDFKDALDKAKAGTVVLNVNGVENSTKEVVVNILAQLISSANLNQGTRIQINTGIATVYISPEALIKNINASSSNVQLTVSKIDTDTLPDKVLKEIGNSTVYDFNLSIDGKKVSEVKSGKIGYVEIPYTLKPGEDPNKIVVYYIDDRGNLEVVKNSRFDPATDKVKFSPKHFSKYTIVYSDVSFSDLASVSWAKDSIIALASRGIISGTGNGKFAPANNVTRAEFLNMLMQAFDLADANAKCSFSDVKIGAWYYESVASAQKLGIVNGKGDGTFGINDGITRQDMAVMAYKAALLAKVKLNANTAQVQFNDKAEIASYAVNAVTVMQKAGIISGVGKGKFAPQGNSTRAQAAVIIYRLFSTLL